VTQPFEITEVDGVAVVSAPEEIDITNAPILRSALLTAVAGHGMVIADLSGTEFCDSSGLNVLVRALHKAQEDGGEVRLIAAGPAVLRILSVTGIGAIFPVYKSVAAAIAGDRSGASAS
jgi:anti-sigma B factor antagonist